MTVLAVLCLLSVVPATAESLHIATAANFKPTLANLLRVFDPAGSHTLRVSSASTGTLYAQALHGAPFDVLLAADARRPQQLEREGYAVAGTRATYAIGQLVLVYRAALADIAGSGLVPLLNQPGLSLAIANPEIAPYGAAAQQVLERPGLRTTERRLLRASNVLQAFQMWHSGGADAALVARSLVRDNYLLVPSAWHDPLAQQAVLMQSAANKPLARQLLQFLLTGPAQTIIRQHGYLSPGRRND